MLSIFKLEPPSMLDREIKLQVKLNGCQDAYLQSAVLLKESIDDFLKRLPTLFPTTSFLKVELCNFIQAKVAIVDLASEVDASCPEQKPVDFSEGHTLEVVMKKGQRCTHNLSVHLLFNAQFRNKGEALLVKAKLEVRREACFDMERTNVVGQGQQLHRIIFEFILEP